MPNPKRRHSKTRGRKRRTHYKAEAPTLAVDPASGETHIIDFTWIFFNIIQFKRGNHVLYLFCIRTINNFIGFVMR